MAEGNLTKCTHSRDPSQPRRAFPQSPGLAFVSCTEYCIFSQAGRAIWGRSRTLVAAVRGDRGSRERVHFSLLVGHTIHPGLVFLVRRESFSILSRVRGPIFPRSPKIDVGRGLKVAQTRHARITQNSAESSRGWLNPCTVRDGGPQRDAAIMRCRAEYGVPPYPIRFRPPAAPRIGASSPSES